MFDPSIESLFAPMTYILDDLKKEDVYVPRNLLHAILKYISLTKKNQLSVNQHILA